MNTKHLAIAILGGSAFIAVMIFVGVWVARTPPPSANLIHADRPVPPPPPTETPAQQAQRLEASVEASLQKERGDLVAATPARREQVVKWCATSLPNTCTPHRLDVLITSGANPKEQEHLRQVSFAVIIETMAKTFTDGDANSESVASVASALHTSGKKTLDLLQTTSLPAAAKDPDGSRGKVIRVGGNVVEIHKHGDMFEGSIATDDAKIAYFVTTFDTDGIYEGTWAAFRGVFVQEYDYPNVSGGQTRSQLLIGSFLR
jgi:hypothetical protein